MHFPFTEVLESDKFLSFNVFLCFHLFVSIELITFQTGDNLRHVDEKPVL